MRAALIAVCCSSAAAAWASDYVYTTNRAGSGVEGKRLTLSTKTVTFGGVTVTDVPCQAASATVDWSPNGQSIGLARDYDYGSTRTLWAAINSADKAADCNAAAGSGSCMGVGTLTAGSSPSQSYDPTESVVGAVVPDALGHGTAVTIGEKTDSKGYKWTVGGAATAIALNGGANPALTQLAWVDGTDFGVTQAGSDDPTCDTGSYQGTVKIVHRTNGATLATRTIGLIGSNTSAKPEGIDIVPVDAGNSASCTTGTTHVVYVADHCQDVLFVYSWDGTTLTLESTVALANIATLGLCRPSHVRYHDPTDHLIVACQTRGSLEFIEAAAGSADQCDPAWESSVPLYFADSSATCAGTPTSTACNYTTGDCQVHDIAWDSSAASGWVFTNLSGKGQVVAVHASGTHYQSPFYRDTTSYEPIELEIGTPP